ncbi:hypothetical protein EVAR_14568_1 [Eumeta japonica]|uniref:Uncharacterized protein n=1 Tax=Eumeta variegata TaxID=151549 RepID=A0A4C1UUA1_EUMVA|nr:hypothetical protein EVAR_14568_1 [Eumeta japonica]
MRDAAGGKGTRAERRGNRWSRKDLNELELNDWRVCLYEQTEGDLHYVLWSCLLYDDLKDELLNDIEMTNVGPIYYADVGTADLSDYKSINRHVYKTVRRDTRRFVMSCIEETVQQSKDSEVFTKILSKPK